MAARITAYLVAIIVAVTFIAGLIVGAQREDGPVDLIVLNGSVYTADGAGTMAEAVAVQGNKILMVGSNREVQRLRRPQTVVVDARGGAVLPGFNDTRAQFIAGGLALTEVNLEHADSAAAIGAAIRAWAAAHPAREWVVGSGWQLEAFDDEPPTRQQLDEIVPDRPAYLLSHDGSAAWANTLALAHAAITRRSPNPANGVIVRDSRTGEPTGLLKGAAVRLVGDVVPPPTREERLAALRAAVDEAHRRGVTSVHHASGTPEDLEVYEEARRNKELSVRVYAALKASVGLSEDQLSALDALRARFGDDPLFKAGAISLAADEDTDPDALSEAVAALDQRGWQVIVETVGEEALRVAIDAIEFAIRRNGAPERGRRHRIDHPDPADVDATRLGNLGVIAALQPHSGPADGVQDPILGLFVGVNRTLPDGVAAGGWFPSERMTLLQAIDAYTREAAWASFDEHRKGTIERDMLADLVVLTEDIFALDPARIADADVAVTIFDGKVVYTRAADTND